MYKIEENSGPPDAAHALRPIAHRSPGRVAPLLDRCEKRLLNRHLDEIEPWSPVGANQRCDDRRRVLAVQSIHIHGEHSNARGLPEIPGIDARLQGLHTGLGSRKIGVMVIRLSDDKKPPAPKREGDRQTGLVLEERTRTKKPPMYKVLLHNDDYTTREFVVWVLQTVFHKNETDAVAIMSHVHNNGIGVAGVYTFEVAETKVTKTLHLAKAQQFPLQLSIEPTE